MADLTTVFGTSVNEAVSASISANKPLVVYITDSSESSNVWIQSFMTQELVDAISDKAVSLKLIKDTAECQMFEQIFPNVIVPSIFCIRVAAVLDIIHGEVDKEAFIARIHKALETPPTLARQAPASPIQQQPQLGAPSTSSQATQTLAQTPSTTTPRSIPATSTPPSLEQPSASQSTTSARGYKTLKEQAAEMSIKKYKEEQLRKKAVEREEKERVKRLLKADEEERKLRARRKVEERERQRRLSNDEEISDVSKIDEIIHDQQTIKDNIHNATPSHDSDVCVLSIKLLDGTSLRHSFKVTETLNDVREWLDNNRTDGSDPYCFHRTIPRLTFGVTDELKSLESLELAPRSALILKPFSNSTNAYSNTGSSKNSNGLISKLFGGLSAYWSGNQSGEVRNTHGHSNSGAPESVNTREDPIETQSPESSQYASPAHSPLPTGHALDLTHPSALSLNLNLHEEPSASPPSTPQNGDPPHQNLSRGNSSLATPRIRTLNNSSNDDFVTYNGNRTNLEDDKK